MSNLNFRKQRNHRGFFFRLSRHLPTFILLLVIALLLGGGIFAFSHFVLKQKPGSLPASATASEANRKPDKDKPSTAQEPDPIDTLIAQADRLAKGYDYDKAMELLQQDASLAADSRIEEAVSTYQSTKDEFLKILDALYNDGYVLVRIHDIAYETSDENGNPVFTWGNIMLPEGKKPIVMSQDDVCYYPYMDGDGFASKIIIGEDGRPSCEMKMEDGTVSAGSYDLVPILNDFIDEHPDFSYKGAKAIIALTGYEGIFGYRTASSYSESPDYERERELAAKVAQCLRDDGWELASHSWGHLWMGVSGNPEKPYKISDERFYTDTDKWENEVESLIGPTDIYIYPNGNDIADWHPYTEENYRYQYLASKGFRYFCNVDASKPAWIQMGHDYLRMARRNLDGYRLYEDMIQEDPAKKRLSDLFDSSQIFDTSRPTPVTWNYGHTQNETPAPEPEQ